jgi:glycosyltransferase involved in cell wall biosynthesis
MKNCLKKPNIGIVNLPVFSSADKIALDKHIRAISPFANMVFVYVSNFKGDYLENVAIIDIGRIKRPEKPSILERILDNIKPQLKLIINIAKSHENLDLVLFDIGEYRNVFALLFSKFLGKKTLVIHRSGNKFLEAKFNYSSGMENVIPYIQEAILRISYRVTDYILCESPRIIEYGGLTRFRKKIRFYKHFVETDRFKPIKPPSERENIVGYAGRLTRKKGIINLVKAASLLRPRQDVKFVIIGDGELKEEILHEIKVQRLYDRVEMIRWVPDEDFPLYLAKMKIFALPSYEEGVPITLLEAMACGTIVLATPVGGIPDVIKDGETGFILKNNEPENIAEGIIRILNHSHLDIIAKKARNLIEKEYNFKAVSNEWGKLLQAIISDVRKMI